MQFPSSSLCYRAVFLAGGGEDVCPGSLPGEVGAGHLIPVTFGFYRGFNTTLCVQSIEPWLVFVCQRC